MQNEFISYAVIEHHNYAGEGYDEIIGVFNAPESINRPELSEDEQEKLKQEWFKQWYKSIYGEYPYPTALRWWDVEYAVVKVSTDILDIREHFNKI